MSTAGKSEYALTIPQIVCILKCGRPAGPAVHIAAVRHVKFVKCKFFNGRSGQEANFASVYQTSQRSVKPLRRYREVGDFFKMAAATILDFQKFKSLTVHPVPGANMRHLAKFHQDRWNGR